MKFMQESKLIQLLGTFSIEEFNQYGRFLESPFFMKGKNLSSKLALKAFRWLKKHHPGFRGKHFTKENLFSAIYPGKKYQDSLMKYLLSILLKLAEEFLSFSQFSNDMFSRQTYLLDTIGKRKLDKMFLSNMKKTEAILENENKSFYYYYRRHSLTAFINDFCIYRKQLLKSYNLQSEADLNFTYFIARMLVIYRNMKIDNAIYKTNFNFIFLKEITLYIKTHPELIENNYLLAIYYYEFLVNTENDDNHYFKLKKLKEMHLNELDDQTVHALYSCLNSYCINKINVGLLKFRQEKFELDIEIFKSDITKTWDYIPLNFFIGVLNNSIELREFKWTERFSASYKPRLDLLHAAFAVNYIKAEYEFAKGSYSRALNNLNKINIEYSQQKQQMRNLMLKIYYETNEVDSALFLTDSIQHILLKDKQLTERQGKNYKRFLRFYKELIKLKCNPEISKLSSYEKTLSSADYFRHKEWLLDKTKELKAEINKSTTL